MKKFITILFLIISTTVFSLDTAMEGTEKIINIGKIITYSNLEDAQLIAESNPTVLFFFASWCPTCRSALKQIESNIDDLGNITIFIVDYDENTDLKRRYGVTYQHTYVQIDSQGNKISLWNGGDIESILENVDQKGMN